MTNNLLPRRFPLFVCGNYIVNPAERDLLARHVLPDLEERCMHEGMTLAASDVSVIAARYPHRELIGACIDDIRNQQCYMIGIIGAGAETPTNGNTQHTKYPWQCPENVPLLSAVELDLIESVFANPFLGNRCFIYVHESLYQRLAVLIPACGNLRLKRLLQGLTGSSGAAMVQLYHDHEHLCGLVCNDIGTVIESTARAIRDGIGAFVADELAAHEAFAISRRLAYVPIGTYEDKISKLMQQPDAASRRIAIIGESGTGKSAFLAYWSSEIRTEYREQGAVVIEHYVGASPNGSNETVLLRHVLAQLRQACPNINEPVPPELDGMVDALHTWPAYAGNRKVIVMIDGMDRLSESPDGLRWLSSPALPANLILVISTQPHGNANAEISKPLWEIIEMEPLNMDERWRLLGRYLDTNANRLPAWLKKQVSKSDAVTSPLLLRVVIEGIFIEGALADIEPRLQELLSIPSVDALFDTILDRLEEDPLFEKKMVQDLLCLLHVSRNGLTLDELEDLLDPTRLRRPHKQMESKRTLAVRALVQRLGTFIVSSNGLLKFFHDSLGDTVERRYMGSFGLRRIKHDKLANYFATPALVERRGADVPWHLHAARRWTDLKNCLAAISMFMRLSTEEHRWSLLGYWYSLKADNSLADVYRNSLNKLEPPLSPEDTVQILQRLGEMFLHAALFEAAKTVLELAIPYNSNTVVRLRLQLMLSEAYHQCGDLEQAEKLLVALTQHAISHPDEQGLILEARERLARLYCAQHDYIKAGSVLDKALPLSGKIYDENHPQTLSLLTLMGLVAMQDGRFYAAEHMFRQVLKACERLYKSPYPAIASALGNLASALQKQGSERWLEAMNLVKQAAEINERIYPAGHPETAYKLSNLAYMLRLSGQFEEAKEVYLKALKILTTMRGNHQDMAICLNNLGTLYTVMGQFHEAKDSYQKALDIYLLKFEPTHLPVINVELNLAWLRMQRGNYLEAAEVFASMIPLKIDILGLYHPDIQRTMMNLRAAVEALRGQDPEDIRVLKLCSKLADFEMQLGNYAVAAEFLTAIIPCLVKVLGADHPDTLRAIEQYKKAGGISGDGGGLPQAG